MMDRRVFVASALGGLAGLAVATVALAGWQEGVDAYNRGDYRRALHEFRPLAQKGDARAQYNLAVMYHNGHGVPPDDAAAATWYRRAAEQGHPDAQFNLGILYAMGRVVPQNYVTAHKWFHLATSRYPPGPDHDDAATARDAVASSMTPAQIAEAQRLATEWRPQPEKP